MTIGNEIRRVRLEKNITQSQLAARLKVSQAMIAQYESGKRIPKIDTIRKIAIALDVSITDILTTNDFLTLMDEKTGIYHEDASIKITPEEQHLLAIYNKLNASGKHEATKRVEELTEITKYTKTE